MNSAMEGVVSSRESFHEADQRIGMFHNGIGNDSRQREPTYEHPPASPIDRETLAQDTTMETANGDGTEPVAAISSHKDVLVTSGQNAGQDELPLAGGRKGQLKQQTDLAVTLVHGDALILQGDDFEEILIGTQAAAASDGDMSCGGPELGQSIPSSSWNPLGISRVSEDVEIEEPPDATDPLTALFDM
ncbi:hypothetical protein SERLA73DRAFT_124707 [Serpula lacrymans var. lacrymans S7.3]|uniref:Uncharacterized protein n=2 Tax=Serpula lacrymans var. lacrymans TaxID=341189 RepID=F8Q4A2_SERL3|nr:uncharacterized protein SERLADRAFT_371994 [Serpula lacrymans var. lacrymans S7.9]EGN96957.1 hypothetical protein SERLA73DRAFT_124707 [Serpula lacrymans var. lacrymans S7.3]EGO22552.1 hypothetical protein SERLADRAFT_371994 [Serpula lacrymans var. lacrymans S7.9]